MIAEGTGKSRQQAQGEQPIDLFAAARSAQSNPQSDSFGAVKLMAPAKVNLYLGIGAKGGDGYHEVDTVLHAVALHDLLYLRRTDPRVAEAALEASTDRELASTASAGPDGRLTITVACDERGGVAPLAIPARENIVYRALDELAREIDRREPDALTVHLEKNIPHQGGLGGGSSDAAAALIGAAQLWGIAGDDALLERVAHRLGSDVAFFLHGGCACFSGAGEQFHHELTAMKKPVVLIKPDAGVPTAAAYRAFDEQPEELDAAAFDRALATERAEDVPLVNNLAGAAERLLPELADIRAWLHRQAGIEASLLCGSGSTTFAIARSFADACRIATAAQARGWWARTTLFGSLRAAVVPQRDR